MPKKIKNIDKEILTILSTENEIHVSSLAKIFSYSTPVIRDICKKLTSQYNVSYIRGVLSFNNSTIKQEKRLIAQKAVSFIVDGDTIFLGAGQTVLAMCDLLQPFNKLTVITNSIPVLNELLLYPNITTICVGGVLQHQDHALVGEFSDQFIKSFSINKIFIGTEGFDLEKGASRTIIQENMAENFIAGLHGNIFILAESIKFKTQCTWVWLPINRINHIITDNNISKQEQKIIKNHNNKLKIITI